MFFRLRQGGGKYYPEFTELLARSVEIEKNREYPLFCPRYYCGHITREAPLHLPPDNEFPGATLSEWRLVGPSFASLIVCLCKRMRLSRARIREFIDFYYVNSTLVDALI